MLLLWVWQGMKLPETSTATQFPVQLSCGFSSTVTRGQAGDQPGVLGLAGQLVCLSALLDFPPRSGGLTSV